MVVDCVISIAAKIGEYLVTPIGGQLDYLLCYNNNIEDFRNQVNNLKIERKSVQGRVEAAKRNGEVILLNVQTWLTRVKQITEESSNFFDVELQVSNRCFNGHCPNLKLRYQRSKKAKKKTTVVDELKREVSSFHTVSHPAPPQGIVSQSIEDAEVFESRKSTSKEIMEALKDDQINMIGIYGMRGVGKTTLVKEVGKHAKDDNLFDEVVMAGVSQTPNLRRIQGEIADMLGLKFDAESDPRRAGQLFARLTDKKRKLVILDDIWDRVELEDIGIPFRAKHKGCKIVFTSRRQDVCEQMNTQKNFPIEVLSEREAWNLFRKMAGDCVDSPDLRKIAVEVAKECAGLPLAIVTVAKLLKNRSDTATQLRSSDPSRRVVECLELSYNNLATEEAKSFFLLCCLFPEDHDIAIQDLLKYGMGLGLFKGVDTVDQAIERAHRLAEDLKSSCLLLESSKKECVKMHDVVRDVAISIASKGKHVFLVRAGQGWKGWPKQDTFKHYTAISLMSDDIPDELPDGLECPQLRTLLLECSRPSLEFPNNFFLRMKNLKVLNMSGMRFLSLPPSLRYLENLQTLCLDRCSLNDISLIGELRKLEILSFLGSDIKELLKEIGTLTQLRLLDLTGCKALKIIPPDVIRGLSQLEGLYMEGSFEEWENIERQNKERSNASLAELKHLSRLTTLEIHISDANLLPDDLLFENLTRFKISIGTRFADWDHYSYSKILKLKLNKSTPLKDGVNVLFKKAEHLHLIELKGLKSVLYGLHREGFQKLKCLKVEECNDMEYLFDKKIIFPNLEALAIKGLDNLKDIWHPQLPAESFPQLRVLEVENCHKLLNVFPSNMLQSLKNLEEVFVKECVLVEKIFEIEGLAIKDRHGIGGTLSRLRKLKLRMLPKLIHIWLTQDPHESLGLHSLTSLDIYHCHSLINIFSPSTAATLLQLKEVHIDSCDMMEVIVAMEREGEENPIDIFVFPQVHTLTLRKLRKLTNFYNWSCEEIEETHEGNSCMPIRSLFDEWVIFPTLEVLTIEGLDNLKDIWHPQLPNVSFPQLRVLEVERCHKLLNVVPSYSLKGLKSLEEVSIKKCDSVEIIFEIERLAIKDRHGKVEVIGTLSQLRKLELSRLPKLFTSKHPFLQKLQMNNEEFEETPEQGNSYIPMRSLFNERLFAFPILEILHIEGHINVKQIWHNQLPTEERQTLSFQNLCSLEIFQCHNLSVFSPSIARGFVQLQRLKIHSCEMMKEIITEQREGEDQAIGKIVFPQLQTLELEDLPNLTNFFQGLITQKVETNDEGQEETERDLGIPIQPLFNEKVAFPNLEKLYIHSCNSLRNVFSPSKARGLVRLQRLDIRRCKMMKEIIAEQREGEDEAIGKIAFPQLHTLHLQDLPNLTTFCRGSYILDFPSLVTLNILACDKIKAFAASGCRPITEKLETNDEGQEETERDLGIPIQPLFNEKVTFPILEELTIQGVDNLKDIWHPQLPAESFGQLRVLKVKSCHKLLNVVPSYSLKGLKNLEKVSIAKCDLVEIIFEIEELADKGKHGTGTLLSKLRKLELSGLPKLLASKHPFMQNPQTNDEELEEKLEEGSSSITIRPLFDEWVTFPTLEKLTIKGLDNLKDIWHPQLPPEYFGQLRVLKVKSCHKLLNVVPSYSLKGLKNLEEVSVAECDLVEIIFEIEELADKGKHGTGTLLSKMRKLELRKLPKLFTSKHPFLQKLKMNDEEFEEKPEEGSSSIPIRPLFNEWVAFPNLEELCISNIENLQEIFHCQLPAESFCQVRILEVTECDKLLRVAPSNLLPRLKNLKKLVVEKCNSMEEIFEVEGLVGEGHAAISLFQLNNLELRSLPKLGIFCSGNYNFELPSLNRLELRDCPKMQTFSSGFISTPKLNNVRVEKYESLWKGNLNSTIQHLFQEKGKLKSDISNGREVEEEGGGEKVNKKFEEADKVEEDVERGENVSAPAIQHEISELAEEEA